MKQSTLAPLGTPLQIRFKSGVGGGGNTATPGVTYVLQQASQQQQQLRPGVLRPVTFIPQQQHGINGGGSGGQVLIRRFPNNNVVHVRRVVSQQQQQLQKGVVVCQKGGLGGEDVSIRQSAPGVGIRPILQHHSSISVTTTGGGGGGFADQVTSSGSDSEEFNGDRNKLTGKNLRQKNGLNGRFNGGDQSRGDGEVGNEGKNGKRNNYSKLLVSGKRKRVAADEDDGEDNDEGDLLIDHVEENDDDEEDQEGDVIDDDGDDGEDKSALELNAAGVDSGFLKHVIETQILNRHKAKIKDWDGTKGHMCQSCHETFLSENGLEAHRNRRIHHILFFCRYCKRELSFFNKCRLLQHLRNHRATPTVSSLQNCVMITLLTESNYLHFKYEDCTSSSDEDDEETKSSSQLSGVGGAGGGGYSSGNGSGNPSKRLKPSRFRRIMRPSITGRESDNSPPPNISRQIVAPPQLSSPPPSAENSTTTIVSTLNNASSSNSAAVTTSTSSTAVGTIQFSSTSAEISTQPNVVQVAVIKSTGNDHSTTSVILPAASLKTNLGQESSVAADSSDSPQIRIRNLSQITVSVNEEEDNSENVQEEDNHEDKMCSPPVLQSQQNEPPPSSTEKSATPPTLPVMVTKKEYRCYKCDRVYRGPSELFKHLEETEQVGLSSRSLHRCPTDDIPSWSQCQYVFHTKVFHEKSVPFMCPGCGKESPDYNSLLEHVTNDCFYLSQRARYMCAATVSKCSFSDRKSVKTEPEIIDHLKKEHSRSVLQCLHCTQGFATDNWLLKHLSESHGIQFDESKCSSEREALINKTTRPLTQCLICNILFPNGPTYLQHVYLNFHMHIFHAKMFECQNCLVVFVSQEEILAHRMENKSCRNLDPFSMKISEGAAGNHVENEEPAVLTPIKVITNPTAPVQQSDQQTVTPKSQAPTSTTVVAVITSSASSNPVSSSRSQQQTVEQKHSANHETNSSQMISSSTQQNSNDGRGNHGTTNNGKNIAKKTIFDDLLSCQFCERLVVFSSLRKHEDQCCGLSTVDPGFCLTCKQYFGDKTKLARHGIVHIREGLPICLFCNNRHIRPTHPKSTTPSAHENLYALKKHLYSNHTSKIVQFPFKCSICSAWCVDKRACEFHIKDHQFKYRVKPEEPDPSPEEVSPEELQKMVKVRRKGVDPRKKAQNTKTIEVYYCPVCKNREFALESGLARHLKLVHQKNPKSINLSLLKKASTARRFVVKAPETASSVLGGVGLPHNNPKTILRSVISSGGGGGGLPIGQQKGRTASSPAATSGSGGNNSVTVSSTSGSNSFTSRFSSGIVLRKRLVSAVSANTTVRKLGTGGGIHLQRQMPNTRQRASSTTTTTTTTTPSSNARPPSNFLQTRSASAPKSCRRKDGTLTCLKCPEFSCKSENEFCEHVKWNHVWPDSEIQKLKFGNKLEEPSEYWCPECNTMLVAKPSLVRHLKYAHDYISSAEEYMQKIGYDGKKPLKPHQCDVCYYQCADDREHQQHIRTHGMAFLRLRQQRQMSVANK